MESLRRRREKKAKRQREILSSIDRVLAEYEAVCIEHKLKTAENQ